MSKLVWAVPCLILAGTPLGAEPPAQVAVSSTAEEPPADEAAQAPGQIIIVEGEAERRKVIVGSRVPKRQIIQDGPIATSTGVAGLVPGSGMDPFVGRTRTLRTNSCVSSDESIRKPAACLIVRADEALADGDSELSAGLLRTIISDDSSNNHERLAAAQRLHAIGDQLRDADLREQALVQMLATGLLANTDTIAAHRSLAAIAIAKSEPELAIARLTSLLRITPGRAQDWVNLAVLQRAAGEPASRASMQRAIELQRAAGRPVAPGWESFVDD